MFAATRLPKPHEQSSRAVRARFPTSVSAMEIRSVSAIVRSCFPISFSSIWTPKFQRIVKRRRLSNYPSATGEPNRVQKLTHFAAQSAGFNHPLMSQNASHIIGSRRTNGEFATQYRGVFRNRERRTQGASRPRRIQCRRSDSR